MKPLLSVRNLSKVFGSLTAVQDVSFDLFPGEVLGLAGSIGSGKSVLVTMLAGLYPPSEGEIYFDQKKLTWPFNARDLGIGIIHQRPELADDLDITSNIFLGNELGKPGFLGWFKIPDRAAMDHKAREILSQLEISIPSLREHVCNLPSEQQQMIAIARIMTRPQRMILIDEPTVLLSYANQQTLLKLIHMWQMQGTAVIFSSNNLEHLFAVSDRIITLYQGKKVGDQKTDATTQEEILSLLVGLSEDEGSASTIWAFNSYYRAKEKVERLRYHQLQLEREATFQESFDHEIINQLTEQIFAFDQANLALQEAHRQLLSEREQERKHLARELHDQIIQDLLSVNYQLENIETRLDHRGELKKEIGEVRGDIRSMIENLRRICGNLRPPTIDSLGLGAAIQSFAREWSKESHIQVHLEIDPHLKRLPEAIELSIFRIVQEGLNNVRKHAHARCVNITLAHTTQRSIKVSISDDGIGFPEDFDLKSAASNGHYGLLGISERVALHGGRLQLQRKANGGSLLEVELPHPRVETQLKPVSEIEA